MPRHSTRSGSATRRCADACSNYPAVSSWAKTATTTGLLPHARPSSKRFTNYDLCRQACPEEACAWEIAQRLYSQVPGARAVRRKGACRPDARLRPGRAGGGSPAPVQAPGRLAAGRAGDEPSRPVQRLAQAIQARQYPGEAEAYLEELPGRPVMGMPGERRGFQSRRNLIPAPVSSFIGRETVLEEILELVQQNRLVTLAGAGGVGKTRLALETARRIAEEPSLRVRGSSRTESGTWS